MDRDAYLLHQVHTAKLATDIGADVISTWLMWRRRPGLAVLVAHTAAAAASAAALARGDLARLRASRRGRYVLANMPPSAQALRYLGQVVAWHAAYRHRPAGVIAGHILVVAGWSYGRLPWRDRLPTSSPLEGTHQG